MNNNYKKFLELKNQIKKYANGGKIDKQSPEEVSKQLEAFKKYASGGKTPKLGTGERFAKLEHTLANKEGIKDPAALAASIGRKKYGKRKMQSMAHKNMADGGEVEKNDDSGDTIAGLSAYSKEGNQLLQDYLGAKNRSINSHRNYDGPKSSGTGFGDLKLNESLDNYDNGGEVDSDNDDNEDLKNAKSDTQEDNKSIGNFFDSKEKDPVQELVNQAIGKNYSDGGQVQESQQKQYQAKDYFGKGANGAGEGVANSSGIAMTMSDGGDVPKDTSDDDSPLAQLAAKIREAFKAPPIMQQQQEPQEDPYTKIRRENAERMSGQRPDYEGYSMGGPVAPMAPSTSANTASSLSPLLKSTYAGPDKKKEKPHIEHANVGQYMAYGGWTPERIAKAPHPIGLPGVHSPADPKLKLSLQRAPSINIPKRLRSINDIRAFADGGDVSDDNMKHESVQGDEQQVPASILESQYVPEEEAANQAADQTPDAQSQDQKGLLARIDAALGNQQSSDTQDDYSKQYGNGPLEGMPDEDSELEDQYEKEENEANPDLTKEDLEDKKVDEDQADKDIQDAKQAAKDPDDQQMPSPSDFDPITALKQAQQNRDKIQMWNQLGAISDRMGAQMGHFAPTQQATYQQNIAMANQGVQDVMQRIAQQGDDPNSLLSQQFRAYLEKFGGEAVDPRTTANIGKQILPFAFKNFEAEEAQKSRESMEEDRTDQRRVAAQQHADMMKYLAASKAEAMAQTKADREKAATDKLQAQTAQQADQSLSTSRQPMNVRIAQTDFQNTQKALNTINQYKNQPGGLDSMDPKILGALQGEVVKIATSGAPTEGGMNKFDPNTWSEALANKWQQFVNHPVGANASAFINQYEPYLKTIQGTAGQTIYNFNKSTLDNKKRLMNPDDYDQRISTLVKPYEQFNTQGSPSSIPGNPQATKQVVRKGYNSATNQTQFIYNDGTSEIKDGKL